MKHLWSLSGELIAMLSLLLCASCASQSPATPKLVRYQGHYTLGAASSTFTPAGSGKRYVVLADDLPENVYREMKLQPSSPDLSSESGSSVSVFAEVEGYTIRDPAGALRFHAVNVLSTGPAKRDYLASLATWPPPAYFH